MNWFDVVIVLVLALYSYRGWRRGGISIGSGLLILAAAVAFAVLLFRPFSGFLEALGASEPVARALSFMILWTVALVSLSILASRQLKRIPEETHTSTTNRIAGIIPGIIEGVILIAFVALLMEVYPGTPGARETVRNSAISRPLVAAASTAQDFAVDVFGEAIRNAMDFITIEPDPTSHEKIDLGYTTTDVHADQEAEAAMLEMVNQERTSHNLKPLVLDPSLRAVAREHSRDMFARGYFSHVNPDNETPFDRMRRHGIGFSDAGENLALAPTVRIAHEGLMKSPGHRANILSPEFGRVGIGAITSRARGTMYTQVFRD